MRFIPVQIKFYDSRGNKKKSVFATGTFREQTFCDIDVREIIRVGGKILKIHNACVWDSTIPSPFKSIMEERFARRTEAKKSGKNLLADLEKQNMCSVYGKTVCKDISDKWVFISKKNAARGIDVSRIKAWEEFDK